MRTWILAARPGRDSRSPHARRSALTTVLAVTGALLVPVLTAGPAWATPAVQVQNAVGTADASTTEPTAVTVSGTGFQSVQGGFGGIYVMFGWVDQDSGAWAPSQGGTSGVDYRYAADTASVDNEGFQRFVAFPGSDTAAAANGGEIAADGTWSVTLTIPTPQLDLIGLDGATTPVDCTVETCGIITIGAHGVANAANESFTPITFVADLAADDAAGSGTEPEVVETPGTGTVEADQGSAVLGGDLAYTGDGFAADEAVEVAIDDAVLGQATADADGHVADAVALAEGLGVGEHELRLVGQESGTTAVTTFVATRDPAQVSAQEAAVEQDGGAPVGALVAVGVVLLVLVGGVVVLVRHRAAALARTAGTTGQTGTAQPGTEQPGTEQRGPEQADDEQHPSGPAGP